MELSLDLNKRYTYADYYTWWDNTRRELLHGLIKLMSPAPAPVHQRIILKLSSELYRFVRKRIGKC
jgi:hypothetical protein